jgi:hypothetical protein
MTAGSVRQRNGKHATVEAVAAAGLQLVVPSCPHLHLLQHLLQAQHHDALVASLARVLVCPSGLAYACRGGGEAGAGSGARWRVVRGSAVQGGGGAGL